MRFFTVASLLVLGVVVGRAQVAAPNAAGVSMGHLHYHVRDVEATRKFWMALGAGATRRGTTEVMTLPGVLIFLTPGESSGGTSGSVVNHVAFRVQDFATLEAKGFKIEPSVSRGVGSVYTPDGERIELFDNSATNITFTTDSGRTDAVSDRHNKPQTVPIAFHHIHLYLPQGTETAAKTWYAQTFGGVAGKRWHYEAVDLPGINLNFSDEALPQAPTKGRKLDHIGFEIKSLQRFCAQLEARGVKLAVPYARDSSGLGTASLTDPWGTSIELTEGLNRR